MFNLFVIYKLFGIKKKEVWSFEKYFSSQETASNYLHEIFIIFGSLTSRTAVRKCGCTQGIFGPLHRDHFYI